MTNDTSSMDEITTAAPVLLGGLTDNREAEVPRRWCFGPNQDNTEVAGSCTLSTSSQIVQSDKLWEYQLELNNVAVGWYSLAFCISLDKLNSDLLESITFDARLGDSGQCEMQDTATMTVVRKGEIMKLLPTRGGRTFVRLHRQSNISENSKYLVPSITIKTTTGSVTPQSLELHHIELTTKLIGHSSDAQESVHIFYGENKPDQFIKVGESSKLPVRICAYDISDMGNYVATVYILKNTAYLDIWDIQAPDKKKERPQFATKAYAHHSFQVKDGNKLEEPDLAVAISSTGSQAAVCSASEPRNAFTSLSVYNCRLVPAENIEGTPWKLYKTTISDGLSDASGYIAFRTIDLVNTNSKNERFFKFNGDTFEAYKASGKWSRLFSLTISHGGISKAAMAENLFHGIRGRLFAYTGTRGHVLIWDFKTNRIVSNISVPEDARPARACLSQDGSLVAIAVKGAIRVHDVQSGIRLGYLKESLNETDAFNMDFVRDYLMTFKYTDSATKRASQTNTLSVVSVPDMSIVDTHIIQPKYRLQTTQTIGAPILAFEEGAILNIIKREDYTPKDVVLEHTNCSASIDIHIHRFHSNHLEPIALDGTVFKLKASDVTTWPVVTVLKIEVEDASKTTINTAQISMGSAHGSVQGFYLKELSQLFILSTCYLQVWNLSATGTSFCELAYIWKLDPDDRKHAGADSIRTRLTAKTCSHGKRVHITFSPIQSFPDCKKPTEDVPGKNNDIATVTIPSENSSKIMTEDIRLMGGVQHLAIIYAESDSSVQGSILRYLEKCIHPSSKHSESSLVSLCRTWSPQNGTRLKDIVSKLLPDNRITWIPHLTPSKGQNPLEILFPKIRQEPAVFDIVKVIIDYCTNHGIRTRDSSFLVPIFASMPHFMKLLPDHAREFLTNVSYIPAKKCAFIPHNHIIAQPSKVFQKFWKSKKKSLAKAKYPVLQLEDFLSEPDHKSNAFRQRLFIASFNMLWNYKDNTSANNKTGPSDNRLWKALYVLTLKLRLRPHRYVECHHFNLDVFDNPAIAALVAYKWNTIGFTYWSFRFTFQLIFYILVTAAALLQVFRGDRYKTHVTAVFISIIVFGAAFLWLELLQAIKHGKRYKTIYNLLDILGYTVPVGTSIQQMVLLSANNPDGYTKTLSFAVLIVFLHALFELRVFKSVCKCVSIIQYVVAEIRAFFLIFAAGIVAFAITTLHLLRACPVSEGCKAVTTKFSGDFPRALSTTYFLLGGRYDDIEGEFESEGWEFHIVMAVYLFFTVIVMLNVLIALINVAFNKADDRCRLAWNESRLRYIESAENMSYHIHGFRQSYNWFPSEIFYSATLQEVKAYRKKYHSAKSKAQDSEILKEWDREEEYEEDEEGNRMTVLPQDLQGGVRNASPTSFTHGHQAHDKDDGGGDREADEEDKALSPVQQLRDRVKRLQKRIDEQARLQEQRHKQSQRQLEESQKQLKDLLDFLRPQAQQQISRSATL